MSEEEKMVLELLEEMKDMDSEQCFEKMDTETSYRLGKFINVLCDIAIDRAKKFVQIA